MNSDTQASAPLPEPDQYSVPWKPVDNWIGVILLGLIDGLLFAIAQLGERGQLAQSWLLIIIQLTFLLPVIIIFAWRKVSWKSLGLGKFQWSTLGIGCGLLFASYGIILLHNMVLDLDNWLEAERIVKTLRKIAGMDSKRHILVNVPRPGVEEKGEYSKWMIKYLEK